MSQTTSTSKEKTLHVCTICQYTTPYTTAMKKHLTKFVNPCGYLTDPVFKAMYERYVEKKIEKVYKCNACGKQFKCSNSVYKHKHICKGRQQLEEKVELLTKRLEDIEKKSNQVNLIGNNNQNIQGNTITNINVFGSESLAHITPELLDQCVKRRAKGHVELVGHVHRPSENQNIRIPNGKPNYLLTYDGNTYAYQIKTDVYDAMLNKTFGMISRHVEENEDALKKSVSDSWFHDIMDYLEKYNDGDLETLMMLRTQVEKLITKVLEKKAAAA